MKTSMLLNMMLRGGLLVVIVCFTESCFAGEGYVKQTIDKQLAQLEDLWTAGKTEEYCAQGAAVVRDLITAKGDAGSISTSAMLLKSFSDKEFAVRGSGIGVLSETYDLAVYIANNDKARGLERQKNDALLTEYLGHIRREQIRNFSRLKVLANITPSGVPGGQGVTSGMDPNGISDPVVRSNYLMAIKQNHQNALTNERQSSLKIVEQVSGPIVQHMISTIGQGDVPSTLVTKWLDSGDFNDQEQKEVKEIVDRTGFK